MFGLTITHYIYLLFSVLIFVTLIRKREIVLVSIVGILAVAFAYSGNAVTAIQALCRAVIVGFSDLLSIFIGIALILTMTMAMKDAGVDRTLAKPLEKIHAGPGITYLIIGILMFFISLLIWPSPAVALLGAFFIPLARHSGLPAVYLAAALNLFGHGAALSGDFVIQGVPAITSAGAGLTSRELLPYLAPLWLTMSVITILTSFLLMKRQISLEGGTGAGISLPEDRLAVRPETENCGKPQEGALENLTPEGETRAKGFILIAALFFALDIVSLFVFHISGDDALALIAGTVLILSGILCWMFYGTKGAAPKLLDHMTKGFGRAMEMFAPAIVIIAFFSIGNTETAQSILDEGATGFLSDIVFAVVDGMQIGDIFLPVVQTVAGILYSMDGSGFAGITVIGEIAGSYGVSGEGVKILTSLGQLVIIWVGGGTLIPWAVIPVSAVCGVSPGDLVRKNLVPVGCGLVGTVICAMVLMGLAG